MSRLFSFSILGDYEAVKGRDQSISCLLLYFDPTSQLHCRYCCKVVKEGTSDSGIDTSIFEAHSFRSAATSAAANQGVALEGILKAADWSMCPFFNNSTCKSAHSKKTC